MNISNSKKKCFFFIQLFISFRLFQNDRITFENNCRLMSFVMKNNLSYKSEYKTKIFNSSMKFSLSCLKIVSFWIKRCHIIQKLKRKGFSCKIWSFSIYQMKCLMFSKIIEKDSSVLFSESIKQRIQ